MGVRVCVFLRVTMYVWLCMYTEEHRDSVKSLLLWG